MKARALPAVYQREWNPKARRGWILLFLWQGSKFTNREVGRLVGITRRGAQKMMEDLSADFPIVQVERKWQWMEKDAE